MMLSDVSLSVACIGPKSRTERPRKTKIGTELAHVTRDADTTFKVKRSKIKVDCANFSLPRPLCLDVRERQTSDPHHRLLPPTLGAEHIKGKYSCIALFTRLMPGSALQSPDDWYELMVFIALKTVFRIHVL